MGTYILRRLLWTVFLLFVITALVFFIFDVLPTADPAALRAGRNATPESIAAIRSQLNLDDPLVVRFAELRLGPHHEFDFGTSVVNDAPVWDQIKQAIPNTLMLVAGAAVIWFVAGVGIGMISAVRRGSFLDRASMTLALVAISAPVYWLGLVSLYLFSSDLGVIAIFPPPARTTPRRDLPQHRLALPALARARRGVQRGLRAPPALEPARDDERGLHPHRAREGAVRAPVIFRHGLRSAITPIITVLGLDIGILLGGAILTESVFGIPASGAWPSTPSSATTSRSSRAPRSSSRSGSASCRCSWTSCMPSSILA
jgi:peptide/nickel transport system permease protein